MSEEEQITAEPKVLSKLLAEPDPYGRTRY